MKIQRIEQGSEDSVVLVLEGSQEWCKRLEDLFTEGKLTEILGIPVEDVRLESASASPQPSDEPEIAPSKTLVNLSQWLQDVIEAGWQTVEEILGTERANLVFASRSAAFQQGVVRAKQIDLGMQPTGQSLSLVVAVMSKAAQERVIRLQVHPTGSKTLPPGLKCVAFDKFGKILLKVQAKNADNWIQLDISGKPGEQFSVEVALGDPSATQNFVI